MKKYQYQIIRYVHDHATGEYVNVGVLMYSKEHKFLSFLSTPKYHRITEFFPGADGKQILKLLKHIQLRVQQLKSQDFHSLPEQIEALGAHILQPEDNAIRFSSPFFAVDINLEIALSDLFHSQVDKYADRKKGVNTLNDDEVWKLRYKKFFDQYGIPDRLKPHEVILPNDSFTFDYSWKNEIWHSYEPVSFELQKLESVKDKVYKWAGRIKGLEQTQEPLHLTLLTSIAPGHRHSEEFIREYLEVQHPRLVVEIVTADQAEDLAKKISEEFKQHDELPTS